VSFSEEPPLHDRASRRRTVPHERRERAPATPPQGETVHVTIGRIEVRATPEKVSAAPRDTDRGGALAAYLRERERVQR
jgi:hypothetical protein